MADQSQASGNFTVHRRPPSRASLVVDVKSYGDERGYFMETYKRPDFATGGIDCEFVQDNQSASSKGVLRGLHFQIEHPQSKLVRVVEGRGVRRGGGPAAESSPTYRPVGGRRAVGRTIAGSCSCPAGSPTASWC